MKGLKDFKDLGVVERIMEAENSAKTKGVCLEISYSHFAIKGDIAIKRGGCEGWMLSLWC